jgi:hypothetical protein
MKILGPSTPGMHVKSFNTNRSTRTLSKKKKSAKKPAPQLEIPNITQEYLDKLSEEEL